jgi:5-methylcytosine-specific restriction endonuclease McrA
MQVSEEDRKEERRKYMREYMRKRRSENPGMEAKLAAKSYAKKKDDEEFKRKNRERVNKYREANIELVLFREREAYKKDPSKKIANAAQYRAANQEKLSAYFESHYAANSERIKERIRQYRASNPETLRIQDNNKRARRSLAPGTLSPNLTDLLMAEQGGACAYCDISLDERKHLDHYIPIALGGQNEDWNTQLLCPRCNSKKHAKHPLDFLRQISLPKTR